MNITEALELLQSTLEARTPTITEADEQFDPDSTASSVIDNSYTITFLTTYDGEETGGDVIDDANYLVRVYKKVPRGVMNVAQQVTLTTLLRSIRTGFYQAFSTSDSSVEITVSNMALTQDDLKKYVTLAMNVMVTCQENVI